MGRIKLAQLLLCKRCEYQWRPRQPVIRMCPRCKTRHWRTARTNRRGLRPEK